MFKECSYLTNVRIVKNYSFAHYGSYIIFHVTSLITSEFDILVFLFDIVPVFTISLKKEHIFQNTSGHTKTLLLALGTAQLFCYLFSAADTLSLWKKLCCVLKC